jgi:hypothetical protein
LIAAKYLKSVDAFRYTPIQEATDGSSENKKGYQDGQPDTNVGVL